MSVIVALAPFARPPSEQVTVDVPLHEPCVGIAETNEEPAGSVSVTVTPVAAERPLFVVVIVYGMFVPAIALAGPVFVMARFAEAMSSLLIVPTPWLSMMAPLTGRVRLTKNVSLGSTVASPWTTIVTCWLVWPGVNVTVPDFAM